MTRVLAATLALCLLITGYAHSGQPQDRSGTGVTAMQAVSFDRWDKILEGQRGHVTVVDFWASWCAPCIERFPHMVEMHHEYKDRGVRFISLNLDEQGDTESIEWANEFLARTMAAFPNYHMDENMTEAFERLDLLGLPTVRVYAPDGTETHRLSGDNPYQQFTEKDVEEAVLELLAR
jgi:thiol-disulfide isomerase/thioredoxin